MYFDVSVTVSLCFSTNLFSSYPSTLCVYIRLCVKCPCFRVPCFWVHIPPPSPVCVLCLCLDVPTKTMLWNTRSSLSLEKASMGQERACPRTSLRELEAVRGLLWACQEDHSATACLQLTPTLTVTIRDKHLRPGLPK